MLSAVLYLVVAATVAYILYGVINPLPFDRRVLMAVAVGAGLCWKLVFSAAFTLALIIGVILLVLWVLVTFVFKTRS